MFCHRTDRKYLIGQQCMNTTTYFVEKVSDTAADNQLAVGLALLLQDILQESHKDFRQLAIQDTLSHYCIQLPEIVNENDIQHLQRIPKLVQPHASEKQIVKQAKLGWNIETFGFPYEKQRLQMKQYYKAREFLQGEERRPEAIWQRNKSPELINALKQRPGPSFAYHQTISQMKVVDTFNDIVRRWDTLTIEQMRLLLLVLLTLFQDRLNDVTQAITKWQEIMKVQKIREDAKITALQIINPITGKGSNRAKSGELMLGNQDSFWPLEFLKFVGFMQVSVPFVVRESNDRKTYVLQPYSVKLKSLKKLMDDFRSVCWSTTAVKLDIMASLRFAQVFVQNRMEFLVSEEGEVDAFDDDVVLKVAQGFDVTTYKDLGSAYATMNVAEIKFPSWLPPIKNSNDAQDVLELLREHIQIIQGIQDSKGKEGSEEYELLRFYRDFLSGHDLRPLWKFTTAYSSYLMSQRQRVKNPQRYIRQLSYKGLKIVMSTQHKLTEITESQGFQNIAYAIRYSTVKPQRRRAISENERTYEIRYGLGQKLMRKAHNREEFMIALSEFVHSYNEENARVEERVLKNKGEEKDEALKKLRKKIRYEDIHEIGRLIDEFHSSELICSMLVACGYASDSKQAMQQATPDTSLEETDEIAFDDSEE